MPRAQAEPLESRRLLAAIELDLGRHVLYDADGDRVTIRIENQGGVVIVTNDETGAWDRLTLYGGAHDRTRLLISVKPTDQGGDGRLQIGMLVAEHIFSLRAPEVDIVGLGAGFRQARHITLGSLLNESIVQVSQSTHYSTTLTIGTFDSTSRGTINDDVKILRIGEWLNGGLDVAGGIGRIHIAGQFNGSLRTDRGPFLNPQFNRKLFYTSKVRIDGIATGQISMPRTYVGKLDLRSGTGFHPTEGEVFDYSTTALGARKIIVNGNLVGRFDMERSVNKFIVAGNLVGSATMGNVNRAWIGGDLMGTLNYHDGKQVIVHGDLTGEMIGWLGRNVLIEGDFTGSGYFIRNAPGKRLGLRKFVVKGRTETAVLTTRGDMGRVYLEGGMFRSRMAAGAHPNLIPSTQFPDHLDDLQPTDEIRSSTIKAVYVGFDRSGETFFEQSYILAYQIDRVKLGYAAPTDAQSNPFGVGAYIIGATTYANADGTTRRDGLRAFRITDGRFMVRRIPGTYPVGP